MIKRLLLAALFISFIGNAQKPVYNFKQAEADIQKIIFSNPDAALILIQKTLAQGKLHDSIYASTYNLYGLYHAMKGNVDSSLFYYKKAVNYGKDYHRIKAGIIINLAAAYRRSGDYDNSIKLINQSLKEYDQKDDNTVRAMLLGELASNHNHKLEYKKSVDYLLQAMDILKAEGQYNKLPALRQRLANTYLSMKNYTFAADMYEECLKDFKNTGSEKNYNLTLVNLAEAQIFLKRYNEAKVSLTKAIAGLEKFGDAEIIGMSYSKIGNLEFELGNYSKASTNYQKAIDLLLTTNSSRIIRIAGDYINLLNRGKEYQKALGIIKLIEKHKVNDGENIEDRMIFKDAVAETYNATNNDKQAAEAYEQAVALRDSISINEQENAVHEIQAKYQTQKQRANNIALKNHNNLLQEKIKAEKTMLLLYMAISAVLLIGILLWLRGTRLKNKLQKEELRAIESEKMRIEQQHLYEKELNSSQNEIIEEKQRELASFTLRLAGYQDRVNSVIKRIDEGELVKAGDFKRELQQLIKQNDYWEQFANRFNKVHPDFNNSLIEQFPNFTKNDIEFCTLLKLKLSNKEIASLLQISHESAITKKYRIKKKMNIQEDADFEKLLNDM